MNYNCLVVMVAACLMTRFRGLKGAKRRRGRGWEQRRDDDAGDEDHGEVSGDKVRKMNCDSPEITITDLMEKHIHVGQECVRSNFVVFSLLIANREGVGRAKR